MHLKKENAFLFRQAGNERSQFPQKAQVVTIDCQCVTGYQRTWLCRIEHTPLKICFCLELLRFLVWQAVRPAHQAANMTSLAMGPSTKRECHPIRLRKICQCAMLDVAKYKFPLTCGESIGELDLLYSTDHLTGSNLLIVWILYIYMWIYCNSRHPKVSILLTQGYIRHYGWLCLSRTIARLQGRLQPWCSAFQGVFD